MSNNRKVIRSHSEATAEPSSTTTFDVREKKYAVPQAAEILGISPKTLWTKVGHREVGVYRIGRCVRIGEREIARILEQGFTPARDAA